VARAGVRSFCPLPFPPPLHRSSPPTTPIYSEGPDAEAQLIFLISHDPFPCVDFFLVAFCPDGVIILAPNPKLCLAG